MLIGIFCGVAGGGFGALLSRGLGSIRSLARSRRALIAVCIGVFTGLAGLSLGRYALGGGAGFIREVLLSPQPKNPDFLLTTYRFFGALASYLSGCAGGIFAPSLAAGGAIGMEFSRLLTSSDPHLLAALGMAAFLAGMTHAPLTAFVLVNEMADLHVIIFPLMTASLLGAAISKVLMGESFYHRQAKFFEQQMLITPPVLSKDSTGEPFNSP